MNLIQGNLIDRIVVAGVKPVLLNTGTPTLAAVHISRSSKTIGSAREHLSISPASLEDG